MPPSHANSPNASTYRAAIQIQVNMSRSLARLLLSAYEAAPSRVPGLRVAELGEQRPGLRLHVRQLLGCQLPPPAADRGVPECIQRAMRRGHVRTEELRE